MTKLFLFSHPFPFEFSSAVAKAMAGQAGYLDPSTGSGSVDPHQPSLKLWRGRQTFSRTTCPAKNMLPALAGNEK
jgi:hypothetical protein